MVEITKGEGNYHWVVYNFENNLTIEHYDSYSDSYYGKKAIEKYLK